MSHHFDTKLAKEDPSLNLCDFYLFGGAPGNTVMAMTVNTGVALSTPDTLHPEGLYAFRIDLDGDAREEVTFKFRFGQPRHREDGEHRHLQTFEVRRAVAEEALRGDAGDLLIQGETGTVAGSGQVRAFVGIAPEMFAGDAAGLHTLMTAFYSGQHYDAQAFPGQRNFFAGRNVTAIVLEVPNALIGQGRVNAWATISLHGHAPEAQVSRWGLPLITHLFLNDPGAQEVKEQFNASAPHDDTEHFSNMIADFAAKMTTYAGSAEDPAAYGKQLAARLCPSVLPYELGTPAAFRQANFNGRPLGDDVMDVMLSLAVNQPLADGAAPDRTRIRSEFPYYGEPYTAIEQGGASAVPQLKEKQPAHG